MRVVLSVCCGFLGALQLAQAKNVDIYWTEHGVPHIEARDWYSLGYGAAYAAASQNFCILADQLLRTRSERSLYFGAGQANANIISDVGTKALGYIEDAKPLYQTLTPRAQDLIKGYAAGFNTYLNERSPEQYPRPCKGAVWIKPTTHFELLAYYLSLAERASGQVLMPAVVNAAPPEPIADKTKKTKEKSKNDVAAQLVSSELANVKLEHLNDVRLGSNAWAIGKDMSESGNGLLLGNPHFPGYGALRFYQYRMRIPGVYDVQGASLIGTPIIQIGFNDNLGWTHTVSKSRHFTMYSLELNPQNPLEYKFANKYRPIIAKDISIQLKLDDGSVVAYSRPVYFSHHGPMIETPELKWDATVAFSYRDANRKNISFIDQWLDMGQSRTLTQFKKAFEKYRGTPWVNTLYADKMGNAFYIEGTPVPKLMQPALRAWKQNPIAQFVYSKMGAFLFDGSTPRDEWQGEGGLVSYAEAPQLLRKDYVSNHNDSHWMINEHEKLEGYSPIYGPERTELSYRTRMGFRMLKEMPGKNNRFSLKEVEDSLFSNRSYLWEDSGKDLASRCQKWASDAGAALSVECASLSQFNGKYDLESKGFPVFREFANLWKTTPFHAVAFDPNNPLNTPSALGADANIKPLFEKAVELVKKSNIDVMASVARLQFFKVPDFMGGTKERVPYHGGQHNEGVFNVQDWEVGSGLTLYPYPTAQNIHSEESLLTDEGYPINGGTSFILSAEFTANGPKARGLLTYSQSSDPDSPYYSDQNYLYSQKKLRDFPHRWRDIEWGYAHTRQTLTTN